VTLNISLAPRALLEMKYQRKTNTGLKLLSIQVNGSSWENGKAYKSDGFSYFYTVSLSFNSSSMGVLSVLG